MTYTKSKQWKKEEGERLTGESDKIKFTDFRFERGQVIGFGKQRRKQDHVLWMTDDLWVGVCGLGNKTWRCE